MDKKNVIKQNLQLLGSDDALILEHIIEGLRDERNDTFVSPPQPDVKAGLEEAEPEFPDLNLDWQTIRTLGVTSDKNNQAQNGGNVSDEYQKIADMLAVLKTPFGLACVCDASGLVDFRIGIQDDEAGEAANSLLSASFGLSDMVLSSSPSPAAYSWAGTVFPMKRDVEKLDKGENSCSPAKWADEVAASMIGTDCSCQILFYPIQDSEWIQKHMDCLYEAEQALAEYLKHRPQVSANRAVTDASSENLNKLLSLHKRSSNCSNNETVTLNISQEYAVYDPKMETLEAEIRYRLRIMEQVVKSGWEIRLTVGAPSVKDPDAKVIRAALAASFLTLGYGCSWKLCKKGEKALSSGMVPSYMLPAVISFPTKPFVGLTIKHRSQLELNPPAASQTRQDDIQIGNILWNGADTMQMLRIPRKEMNRHAIVFGMTGGGKSNTVCSMLSSLDDLHYLVIEPVKGEYHVLPNIRRFTMIAGTSGGLKMNPFWFPNGASLQYHIDSLKLIISSAFDLYAAMPNILEQCLYRVYSNCGWDIISGHNVYEKELPEGDLYPTFTSLCDEIERYLNESAFEGETAGNYRGALLSRLQSFTSGAKGMLLNTCSHINFCEWEDQNIVVELDALADDADKAIVMGALLAQYFQFIKYHSPVDRTGDLRHLFVLEEAHHLFKEVQSQASNGSNASGQLVSMLNNLLAEIRAYGEGFIIVDQSPSSVSSSVLKNTAVKIVHRVDYGEDIKLLQSALLLDEDDHVTASLAQGEALVRFGTMQSPAHVKIPYYPKDILPAGQKQRASISTEGLVDRVVSNARLLDALKQDSYRFMNLMLYCSERTKIQEGFLLFRAAAKQNISHHCGREYVSGLGDEVYRGLLEVCVLHSAEDAFPGQYCLHRMIRMFVSRMAQLQDDHNYGGLTEKVWNLITDYREARIFPRLSFYYQNHIDMTIKMIVAILGNLPEVGILKELIDDLWVVPKNEEKQFNEKFEQAILDLFYVMPPEKEQIYMKGLVMSYCEKISNL